MESTSWLISNCKIKKEHHRVRSKDLTIGGHIVEMTLNTPRRKRIGGPFWDRNQIRIPFWDGVY